MTAGRRPAAIEATVRNLDDVGPNIFLNVPRGFEMVLPFLRERRDFRDRFFQQLQLLYYAGAGLSQPVWDELQELAVESCGERILMFTGLGSTETGPSAMFPIGKRSRRARRPARAGRRAEAGEGRRENGSPAAQSQHHSRLLAPARTDARRVR